MLRNRLNDNGSCDYLVGSGCNVAGQRGCVSMRSASFGKRMQRIDLPQAVIQRTALEERRTDTPPATPETPAHTSATWLRRDELPSPIWASLVLGRA
jgi:hypothetical protein